MNYFFIDPWYDFLPRDPGHVVSFMGSGGKTSLMKLVAGALADEGVRVLMTTTTQCEPLADVSDLHWKPGAELPDTAIIFLHGGIDDAGKWRGLAVDEVDALPEQYPDHLVLVEADGSAKLPLKIHRGDEPLWPGRTSLAVVVMGAGAVGCKSGEVIHRFGRETSDALSEHEDWTILEWDHVAELILGGDGYLARVPEGVPAVLALAGLGEQADSIGLFSFADRAMSDPRLPLVMFCETSADPPSVRTACREDEEEAG